MSILIKGMKMPKVCYECGLYRHYEDWQYYDYDACMASGDIFNDGYDRTKPHINPNKEKLATCPLEELVRCKDCKYWRYDDYQNDSHGYCPTNENDYCSRGERKEDVEDAEVLEAWNLDGSPTRYIKARKDDGENG